MEPSARCTPNLTSAGDLWQLPMIFSCDSSLRFLNLDVVTVRYLRRGVASDELGCGGYDKRKVGVTLRGVGSSLAAKQVYIKGVPLCYVCIEENSAIIAMRFCCGLVTCEALAQPNRMRKRDARALYLSAGFGDFEDGYGGRAWSCGWKCFGAGWMIGEGVKDKIDIAD
jgi:hypothetical protein